MFFSATVKDTKGNGVKGVKAEVVSPFAEHKYLAINLTTLSEVAS